jgi:hypothetical protein
MKNQHKAIIISCILVLLVWGLYITFIYMEYVPVAMVEHCREHLDASTKICNRGYTP